MSMSMTVGVGIVGSGLMGRKWAEVAAGLTGRTTLAGVTGGRRAAALAADYACTLHDSFDRLIADPRIGVVVLATPPAVHAAQAIAAARAGKHVLVEKPMANTVRQCAGMIAGCAESGVQLAVVSPHRFKNGTRVAKHFVDGGAIGTITMAQAVGFESGFWDTAVTQDEWKLDPAQQTTYAGWAAHACDLLRWFIGAEADLAFAMFERYGPEPPPHSSAMASYHFTNSAMAHVWMSYDIPPGRALGHRHAAGGRGFGPPRPGRPAAVRRRASRVT
jgi:predicted dehydrogenase